MQTVREQEKIEITTPPIRLTHTQTPVSPDLAKKLKIREFISWSVCFAVISGLTGLLKILKVGVTMDSVTSVLFYLSLAGLVFYISRIIRLSKNPTRFNRNVWHELN